MLGLFFYEQGVLLKQKTFKLSYTVIGVAVVTIMILFTGFPVLDMWKNELHSGHYLVWLIYMGIVNIALSNIFSYNKKIFLLTYAGRYSLEILSLHWIVLSCLKALNVF